MKRIVSRAAALAALCLSMLAPAGAAVLTLGAPTAMTPTALVDPLGSLPPSLDAGLYLLPVEVLGASGLQTFGFGIEFDSAVVAPHDAGGLYQSVYAALFSLSDPVSSEITSAGFQLPGLLDGVTGFAPGVDGDGVLAFVLFELAPGADISDAGFRIDAPALMQVPLPGTASLVALPLLMMGRPRRRRTGAALALAVACSGAAAQSTITATGPYYATPSWDQTIASGRFVVLSNFRSEAVLDRETGLVWERSPSAQMSTHDTAHGSCATRQVGGRLGWRLPAIDELSSLVDPAVPQPGPKLAPGHPFVLPDGPDYWSSTVITRDIDPGPTGYAVRFDGGYVHLSLVTSLLHAWCVRGGSR